MDSSNDPEGSRNQTSRQVIPVPTAWSAEYQGLTPSKGFLNTSTVCYRNSALCFLLHSPTLLNWLAAHHGDQGCEEQCVSCQLHRLAVSFWKGNSENDDQETVLMVLWVQLQASTWDYVDLEEQQDVREFIEQLFGQMYQDAQAKQVDLNPLLKIALDVAFECKTCGKATPGPPYKEFLCAASFPEDLKVGDAVSIEELLSGCYSGSTVDRDCEHCERKTEHLRTDKVVQVPEVLLVHLNRIGGPGGEKSFNNVSLGDQVVLPESLRRGLADKDDICYELYTIIFHEGDTIESGHYTAAVKAPTGRWMLINDEQVESVQSLKKLMNMGKGKKKHSATAYVLGYRRLPLTSESMPAGGDSSPAQVSDSASSREKSSQARARPLDGTPSADPALLVPGSDIAPGSLSSVSSLTSLGSLGSPSAPGSPVRPGVTMDGTISLDGRDIVWTIQQQLAIPSDAGPLIKLKPRSRVQFADIRLRFTSGEEVLEANHTISLKPLKPNNARKARTEKSAKIMNTKSKRTADGTDQKKKAAKPGKQAKPRGVQKSAQAQSTGVQASTKTKTGRVRKKAR
ncbi:cysteine proteinase [Aspergillus steynii IBT 23096]|uniref:Cysteine proteinase n=1 Tax=Aspergillus steynii IBT 23096 TaxID=1392250 RepID=A0A2I2FXJ9_9EURO|nr:cysteine proteinase [Aspergillus steynii IBT 23096]PLB45365.1 cysteine proteinase [Aspergillus steynii IBT 23096]